MTAAEARQQALDIQEQIVRGAILEAKARGSLYAIVYFILQPELLEELEADGYTVITQPEREESTICF